MARKRKGLPFVVQPRFEPIIEKIGTEASGIIEIKRLGYLTVAEKTIVDQAAQQISDQGELVAAVRLIAESEKTTMTEIFTKLQDPDDQSLLEKYAAEIATASTSAKSQEEKMQVIASTALLICRIDPEWTVEESMELHPDLLAALYVLYREEDERSVTAFTDSSPGKGDTDKAAKK